MTRLFAAFIRMLGGRVLDRGPGHLLAVLPGDTTLQAQWGNHLGGVCGIPSPVLRTAAGKLPQMRCHRSLGHAGPHEAIAPHCGVAAWTEVPPPVAPPPSFARGGIVPNPNKIMAHAGDRIVPSASRKSCEP